MFIRGQYSDAVLNELESQNDEQVEGIMGKVKMLKSVRDILATASGRHVVNYKPQDGEPADARPAADETL